MYIKLPEKTYPYSPEQLRYALRTAVSFGEKIPDDVLAEYGVFPVVEAEKPIGEVVAEVDPVLIDGVWTQQWAVTSFTAEQNIKNIAARRYAEEISGTIINGIPVDTDRQSQALITGAALAATIDPAYVCRWKTKGGFIVLDATAIIGVATAVRNHVQDCFNREAQLISAVDDGTYTSDMINEGW